MIKQITSALSALALAGAPAAGFAFPYGEDPDDPVAVKAAASALSRLNEQSDAVGVLSGPGVSIVGSSAHILSKTALILADGVAFSAQVTQLEKAINQLGAVVTDTLIEIELSSDVLFDFDRDELKQAAEEALENVLVLIENKTITGIDIVGHTDAKGSEAYNQALSERRAASVSNWFTAAGIDADLIRTEGLGENDPVAANVNADGSDNPEGRRKNRRVTILLHLKGSADQ